MSGQERGNELPLEQAIDEQIFFDANVDPHVAEMAQQIAVDQHYRLCCQVDRAFAMLFIAQLVAGVIVAFVFSPYAWAAQERWIHIHLIAAPILGALITSFPLLMIRYRPGQRETRYTIAVAQMLWSSLLIHLTGGRIETHFHVFGSFAILSAYRDWRIYVPATLAVTVDHLARGVFFPFSVFGTTEVSFFRILEHGWWVIFENSFLVMTCIESRRDIGRTSLQQAQLQQSQIQLEQSLAAMQSVVTEVSKAGILVGGAASSVGAAVTEQRALVTEQAYSTSQVRLSINEIDQTSASLGEAMQEIADQADQTKSVVEMSNELVHSMKTCILRVVENTERVVAHLADLHRRAGEVSVVVTTITKVSEQTNLLSLNAAIEAYKAGEKGHGFGVIAAEIRRLADQTAVATLGIEATVDDMQSAADGGVKEMDSLKREVRATEAAAHDFLNQLEQISEHVSHMSEGFVTVNLGMKNQVEGVSQISASISEISESARISEHSIESFQDVVGQLQDATRRLQYAVSQYQFEGV